MNPILYDLKKTITNKWVLIMLILIVLIAFAILPLVNSVQTVNVTASENTLGYYYYSSGYHFRFYSFNKFGDPVSGANIHITLAPINGKTPYKITGISNNMGFTNITFFAPDANYTLFINVSSGEGTFTNVQPLFWLTPGQILTFSSVAPVVDHTNTSKYLILVFFALNNNTVPHNLGLYYTLNNTSPGENSTPTHLHFLGYLNTYTGKFPIPPLTNVSRQHSIFFYVFKNNTVPDLIGILPVYSIKPQHHTINVTHLASRFAGGILALFFPLVAIMAAYVSYGKHKITGVLDSILTRPVTRAKLIVSRFTAIFLALLIAISVTMVVLNLLLQYEINASLSLNFIISTILALSVEAAAFISIIFIFAHLFKSTGALIALAIALFIIFDFFWTLIIMIISMLLGASYGSSQYLSIQIITSFFNPAQYYALVGIYMTKFFSDIPINPAQYGVTLLTLSIAGILWVVVPVLIFLYLATHRD